MLKPPKRPSTSVINPTLFAFLTQAAPHAKIQQWRQAIENKRAKAEGREQKTISKGQAKRCFKRALQSAQSSYAEDAENLVRQLWKPSRLVTQLKSLAPKSPLLPWANPAIQIQAALLHFAQKKDKARAKASTCEPGTQKTQLKRQATFFYDLECALNIMHVKMKEHREEQMKEREKTHYEVTALKDPSFKSAYRKYEDLLLKGRTLKIKGDSYITAKVKHTHRDKWAISIDIYEAIDSLRQKGFSWRRIHTELERKQLITKKSFEAFRKWCARRDLQNLYPGVD